MTNSKIKFLTTSALCGVALVSVVIPASAAVTTTTTTTYTYNFPGQGSPTSQNTTTSTQGSCQAQYNYGGGGYSQNGGTEGGYTDTDGDGISDSYSESVSVGQTGVSNAMGAPTKGTTAYGGFQTGVATAVGTFSGLGWGVAATTTSTTAGPGASDSGGSGCFVTTAVVSVRGEADDGPTLTNLRHLRDAHTSGTGNGADRVGFYYVVAPEIVRRIDEKENAHQIWQDIDARWITPIDALVRAGDYAQADRLYSKMVKRLTLRHLLLDPRPMPGDVKQAIINRMKQLLVSNA